MPQDHDHSAEQELPPLVYTSCGWIHGHEILAANVRGARSYLFVARHEPSEEATGWKVEETRLAKTQGGELRAFMCTRKSGLFSSESEAALGLVRTDSSGNLALRPSTGSLMDSGGSWVPRCSVGDDSGSRDALALALGAIGKLPLDGLRMLSQAACDLLAAREMEKNAALMVSRALDPVVHLGDKDSYPLSCSATHSANDKGHNLADS